MHQLYKTNRVFNEIPRKSSSLIMFRPNVSNDSSYYDYQILLLKRNGKLKYGSKFAFPGGVRDPIDFHLLHKYYNETMFHSHFDDENKIRLITAYRETLEEIGLLFFPYLVTQKRIQNLLEIKKRMKSRLLSFREYDYLFPLITQDFLTPLNFVRLITAPYLPHRFDTYFYLLKLKNHRVFNWKQFYNNNDPEKAFEKGVEKWDDIDMEPDEFTESLWVDPLEAIRKYQLSEIDMALPQFLILTILANFKKHQNLEDYVKILGNVKLFPSNYLLENPFVFPYIAYRTKTESIDKDLKMTFPYCTIMPGDSHYPIDVVIDAEQDDILKAELIMKYEALREMKGDENKCRIYFSRSQKRFKAKYKVEVSTKHRSPMNFLKNHELIDNYFKQVFVEM